MEKVPANGSETKNSRRRRCRICFWASFFVLYSLGFGTGGSASRSGPSFLMPKAEKTSLIDRKSDSFAVAEADLYNAFQVIS